MISYPVAGVKPIMSKSGKQLWMVTVILPDGDSHKAFAYHPVKAGDQLEFVPRHVNSDTGSFLQLVPKE